MSKRSKFYMILISLMVLLTSSNLAIKTKAHSPYSINIGYISSTQTLSLLIFHDVGDPLNHYVNQVIIRVDGSQVLSTSYTNQSLMTGGSYIYSPIIATNGSLIEVIASCIEGGSMTACYTVGVGGGCPESSEPEIPGYFGLWLIIGLSIIVSIMVTYKKIWHRKYLENT